MTEEYVNIILNRYGFYVHGFNGNMAVYRGLHGKGSASLTLSSFVMRIDTIGELESTFNKHFGNATKFHNFYGMFDAIKELNMRENRNQIIDELLNVGL